MKEGLNINLNLLFISSLSIVKLVRCVQTLRLYALKIVCTEYLQTDQISKHLLEESENERLVANELLQLTKLNHKHVLKIHETFEDDEILCIVVDYCSRGNLQDVLQTGCFNEIQVFDVLNQIMTGLEYLQSKQIVHRNIKTSNILIYEDGTCKISDFGYAVHLQDEEECTGGKCGNIEYMPPEVILKHSHDYKADIWSVGVVIYELLHGRTPFTAPTQQLIVQNVMKSVHISERLNQDLQILLYAMLSKATTQRPSCKQIFLCKWMRQMMKDNKIFNKHELEQLKKQQMSKNVEIKPLGNSCFDIKKIKSTQASETASLAFSNTSAPPMIPNTSQDYEYSLIDSIPKVDSPAQPQQFQYPQQQNYWQ